MPRKAETTPTVTEGRSKRTPKPNPKYAMDFVQNIRAVSPERLEEGAAPDDEYKPAPKKRLEDSLSPKTSVSRVQVPLKQGIRTVGGLGTASPKMAVTKIKVAEKKSSPAPSKLATFRQQVTKQTINLHKAVQKSVGKPKEPTPEIKSKNSSETESGTEFEETPAPQPTTNVRTLKLVQAKPEEKKASPVAIIKATSGPASKIIPKATSPLAKAPPQQVLGKVGITRGAALARKAEEDDKDPFAGTGEIEIVDIKKIISADKRKADASLEEAKSAKKQKSDALIDFEAEIEKQSVIQKSPQKTVKPVGVAKKEPTPAKVPEKVLPSGRPQRNARKPPPPVLDLSSDEEEEPDWGGSETEDNDSDLEALLSGNKKVPTKKAPAKEEVKKVPPKALPIQKVPLVKAPSRPLQKIAPKPLVESNPRTKLATPTSSKIAATPPSMSQWFVLNFPHVTPQPPRAVLCLSIIKLGNKIKEIALPTLHWSYRITLQRINKENSDRSEVYTGDLDDCGIEENDRGNYAPINITFSRVQHPDDPNGDPIKSVQFHNKSFQILLRGKQCRLIGAPQYIYDVSEIQTLLEIVEKVDLEHSYVERTDAALAPK